VVIGEVTESPSGAVLLETAIGGTRILDMLQGEQLPRIC
jgi:hydrogenase expression/formation protein HypE